MTKFKILLTALFVLFLTACTSPAEAKKTNKPTVPHTATLTKLDTYTLNGRTYTTQPQLNVKHYAKQGKASFYHKKFNGRRTASGEIYRSSELTAAHKTLPFGTHVLITNLTNNRKVVVRINDRGPYHSSRIIDVSKAAAAELGIVGAGTGNVKIEKLHLVRNSNN